MHDDPYAAVTWLLAAIRSGLTAKSDEAGAAETAARLAEQDLAEHAFLTPPPSTHPVCRHLPDALGHAMIAAPGLAAAVAACEDMFCWTQTEGDGFAQGQAGYAYCTLIGGGGFFPGRDFELGLILIGPDVVYRDHFHRAPELYWLLTGPTDWSHASGPYKAFEAGDTIWHPPDLMHATRTLHNPLLAVWAWPRDIGGPVRFR